MARKPQIDRRTFVAGAGVAASLSAMPAAAASGRTSERFAWGVASGDPGPTSIVLWTRLDPAAATADPALRWELALQPDGKIVREGAVRADPERDFTVHVECGSLKPGATYWYRFVHASGASAWGRTRTLPAGKLDRFRIAVVSCSNYPAGFFHAYRSIAGRDDIDLVIHVGDYIYEYGVTGFGTAGAAERGRLADPPHDAVTLADYRRRYAQYRSDPDLRALHARHPMIAIWDDHEVANDTWREGAQNHKPEQGAFTDRLSAAQRAYFEWLPANAQVSASRSIYRTLNIGDLADLVLVDARLDGRDRQIGRAALLADPVTVGADWKRPDRRIMSDRQEAWIGETLRSSKARWQVVAMQNPAFGLRLPPELPSHLDPDGALTDNTFKNILPELIELSRARAPFSLDTWAGYPAARQRFLTSVAANARNPLFVCGDIHTACAAVVQDDDGKQIAAEFVSPAVSSPSFYRVLPVKDAEGLSADIRTANPGLDYIDGRYNGWLEIELTPQDCAATFWSVAPVAERPYSARAAARFLVDADRSTPPKLVRG